MKTNLHKKAQVTVFIIIGVIVLLSVGIFLYVKSEGDIFKPDFLLPQEVIPLKNFIDQCIEDIASPSIDKMAFHGGYIELDEFADPRSYFSLMPSSDLRTALWLYDGVNRMPSLANMQNQISDEVTNNLLDCINNFQDFPEFDIIEERSPETNTIINDEEIVVEIFYPIEIRDKQDKKITKIDTFKIRINKPYGKLYSLAKEIFEYENENMFLEFLTMEIIGFGSRDIFPYEGMEISTSKKIWSIQNDLKPALRERLRANFHCLKIRDTSYHNLGLPCNDPEYKEYFDNMFSIPITTNPKFKNIDVNIDFTFNSLWDFEQFKVKPSSGDIVRPLKVDFDIPLIGKFFKLYHHLYSIKYPVLFILSEDEYSFNFATPVIIRDNEPTRTISFVEPEMLVIDDDDYCRDKQFNYRIEVRDKETGTYLDDVQIDYRCVQFRCDMGKTETPKFANGFVMYCGGIICPAELETKFPYCVNGLVIANKEGYLENKDTFIDTMPNMQADYTPISLIPLETLDFDFKVMDLTNLPTKRNLADDEQILLTIINEAQDYDEIIMHPGNLNDNITLMIGPYTYKIEIILIKDEKLIGGYELDWETTYNMLKDKDKITFSILTKQNINNNEALANFWENIIKKKSKDYKPVVS